MNNYLFIGFFLQECVNRKISQKDIQTDESKITPWLKSNYENNQTVHKARQKKPQKTLKTEQHLPHQTLWVNSFIETSRYSKLMKYIFK